MYIATVPNRSSPPAILLRESYRQAGKVKSRTLANLTHWPAAKIAALRRVLADEPIPSVTGVGRGESGGFEIWRSLPHGHVAAVLGTLRRSGLEAILSSKRSRERDLAVEAPAGYAFGPATETAVQEAAFRLGPYGVRILEISEIP